MRKLKQLEEDIRAAATAAGPDSPLWEWVFTLQAAIAEVEDD